jgi:hypothetical protein
LKFLGENGYLAGISKGSVHVNTTTINPDAASQLEKLHEQHGAYYVAGTVRIVREQFSETLVFIRFLVVQMLLLPDNYVVL